MANGRVTSIRDVGSGARRHAAKERMINTFGVEEGLKAFESETYANKLYANLRGGGGQPQQQPAYPPTPVTPLGAKTSAGGVQYTTAPNGLLVKGMQGSPVPVTLAGSAASQRAREESMQWAARGADANTSMATNEHALSGAANWTDVSVQERKQLLANPNFYKNNEITKYPAWMQQQILADPAFDWKQLPWQQKLYYEASSRPAVMGAVQGTIMGAGNPGGTVVGGVLGAVAAWGGYDQTKEWWQQGEGKWTWDSQQIKDTVNAGFGLMNWAAEQGEKTIGLGFQVANAAVDPNKSVADVFQDPRAAWEAGANFFEVLTPAFQAAVRGNGLSADDALKIAPGIWVLSRLAELVRNPEKYKGQEIYLGASTPVQLDQSWIDRLEGARKEIAAGRNYREVMTEMQTGIMAQIGDMVGQGIADPLNALPKAETSIGAKIAEAGGNKVAAEALHTSGGLAEAGQTYKTLVQTGQALTIDPNFKVDQMGWFSRIVAGVTTEGEVRAGSLIPRDTGLLDPVKNKTGFIEEMTSQTPHSRAQTGAGMFYENIGTLLTMFDDPHEAGKYLSALAKGDMETWKELGSRFAESPEFYTILPALKAFSAEKLDGIIQAWDMTAANREMLTRLADVLGESPSKLLDDLAKRGTSEQDFARVAERLKQSTSPEAKAMLADIEAGRFTAETLKQVVDIFMGKGALPWHPGQWKALMLDTLGNHFDEWVTQRLMLDKSPEAVSAFFRTTDLMKQVQSLLLLGGSPGYAITNGLSNMVHRAATGIYGYLSPNQINSFMERMGVTPARFEEGVGIGGQVEMASGISQVKMDAISKAVKGKGGLTTAKNIIGKASKAMPFSKLSSWFEKTESKQAFSIAMKQFWSQSWRRGVGFSRMSPELVQVIGDMGIAPERIYAAIEAGMNQSEIEKVLFGRYEGVQSRSLVNDAAQKTGMKASDAADMLDKIGLLDALDANLKGKTTPDGVRAAFERARKQARDYIDMQTGDDLKAIAESVKQKVGLEGATAALDVVQKANSTFTDTWMDHYARFGEVMNDLKLLDDPAQRSKAIDFNYQISDEEFRSVYARHAANYQGIFAAWGLSGNPDALKMLAAIGESDAAMRDAYRQMRDIRKAHIEKYRNDPNNPASYDEWAANDNQIKNIFKQAFEAKKGAEIKQGEALGNIYEAMYGPAAGEAARLWWEDVIQFNDEITARERKMRDDWAMARAAGVPKELIDAQKQKYYSETKIAMIAEADRINGEGIARLERVIKGKGGDGQAAPTPSPSPLRPSDTSPKLESTSNLGEEVRSVDEINALIAAAEQRKTGEAKANAERVSAIWDAASAFDRDGLPYDRTKFQDDRALVAALRKPEYGGVAGLTSLNDPRLTPEIVQRILEARRAVKEAAAFAESFDLANVQEIPFDQALWQTEFADTIQRADLTRMYELIGDFPEELSTSLTPDGETFVDFMSRVADETAARVEAEARDQAVAEHVTRAQEAIVAQETRAEAATTRQLMKEKFMDAFHLSEEQATAYMELSDSLADWYANATGENPDAFYTRYYEDVVKAEDGGRGTVDALKQAYNRIEIAERQMTRTDAENYARMLVRAGEGELRRAIRNEANKADRIAILDEAYKLDSKMAESVARGEMDILFQEKGSPSTTLSTKTNKGAVTFDQEGIAATIHAFEAADFSTLVHENGHVFRRVLADVAERTGNTRIKADLATIEDWAGVKDGVWTRTAEEKFARGFEKYIADGKAPTAKLKLAFETFKGWMLEVYKTITGSAIDVKMSGDVRAVFDRMLGGEGARMNDEGRMMNEAAMQKNLDKVKSGPPTDNLFQEADQPLGAYDAASQWYPESAVKEHGWMESIAPLMKNMEEAAIQQLNEKPFDFAQGAGPEGQAMLKKYMRQVQNEMATTKLATVRYGEQKRDFAMLNYSKRYGFDRVAEVVYPYQFYQGRTMVNWAARALDKPAIFSNYARLHNQQNRYERDIPERLRNKIKIPAPWLPDWAGDALYIDPLGSLFPPAALLKPIERMMQDTTYQQIEAERILQEWAADGRYTDAEIRQAAQTRSGSMWERAFAEAQVRRESEVNNPIDFFNTMFGPAWYLTTPYKLASGKANEVTSTPLYNTIRGIDTVTQGTWAEPIGNLIGLLGKPEEWAKKKLGIPEFGEYGDYYIDRQLANMVAEGIINSEQAQIAMIERQGQYFTAAQERVKLELALRVPTMGALYAGLHEGVVAGAQAFLPSLFGAGLLPAGELEFRGLKQEWNEAWDQYDKGNKGAINGFFDQHPEYEAYLAKGKAPEERLKSFLIGQVWDGYMALGTTNQKQARAEMGELFAQAFLNKETRSYDTLDVETLTQWAQMLDKKVPSVPGPDAAVEGQTSEVEVPKLDLYDKNVTAITDQFFSQRTEMFPNYYELQQGYYALASKPEKTKYLMEHPELKEYWNWKDDWYESYPQYKPIFNGDAFDRVDTSGWPPMLEDFVRVYAMTGQRLPGGAYKSLEQVWITEGQPMDNFQTWLNSVVVPGMLYGN